MPKDWSVFLVLDVQVHIALRCSGPHGDEHSFPWFYGC